MVMLGSFGGNKHEFCLVIICHVIILMFNKLTINVISMKSTMFPQLSNLISHSKHVTHHIDCGNLTTFFHFYKSSFTSDFDNSKNDFPSLILSPQYFN